jgi:hypothetical protein
MFSAASSHYYVPHAMSSSIRRASMPQPSDWKYKCCFSPPASLKSQRAQRGGFILPEWGESHSGKPTALRARQIIPREASVVAGSESLRLPLCALRALNDRMEWAVNISSCSLLRRAPPPAPAIMMYKILCCLSRGPFVDCPELSASRFAH